MNKKTKYAAILGQLKGLASDIKYSAYILLGLKVSDKILTKM